MKIRKKLRVSRKVIGAAMAAAIAPLRRKRRRRFASRKIAGAALAVGLVPYHFKFTPENGEFEVRGLLWNVKKASCGEQHSYTVDLCPFLNRGLKSAGAKREKPTSEPAEQHSRT